MELGGDLRYAWRQLRAQRGYAAVAVLTLALGVGANTLAFSLLRGSVLRGLPFPEGDRLVLVQTLRQAPGAAPESHRFTWQQFRWLAGQRTPFTRLALYNRPGVNISAGGEAERVDAEFVSDGYFELLGVAAGLGRYFGPEENATPGTHPVVVLGDALWRRRFGADPGVLGRVVRVNGIPLEVIGVMPRGFGGVSGVAEAWLPEMMAPAVTFVRQLVSPETFQTVIAQLAPGFTAEAAERAMSGLGEQLRRAVPNAESAEPVLDASGVDRLQ
jgi:hypothetical protein